MFNLTQYLLILCTIVDFVFSWYHTNKSLPFGITSQQIAYKHREEIVYLFGGNTTLKWNISNVMNDIVAINDTPPSFTSNSQNTATINDTVYFIGIDDDKQNPSSNIYLFDLSDEEWINDTNINNMPYPGTNGCISTNNSHIFMIGGIYNDEKYKNNCYLQIYDIINNKWMSSNISFLNGISWSNQMCSMVNNTIYVFGGLLQEKTITNIGYKYDVLKNKWNPISNLTESLHNGWSVYYERNKTIYIIGGTNNDNNLALGIKHEIQIFNVSKQSFVGYNNMLDNVQNAASLIVLNNDKKKSDEILIFGGCTPSNDNDKICIELKSVQISELPLEIMQSSSSVS